MIEYRVTPEWDKDAYRVEKREWHDATKVLERRFYTLVDRQALHARVPRVEGTTRDELYDQRIVDLALESPQWMECP